MVSLEWFEHVMDEGNAHSVVMVDPTTGRALYKVVRQHPFSSCDKRGTSGCLHLHVIYPPPHWFGGVL